MNQRKAHHKELLKIDGIEVKLRPKRSRTNKNTV
jgi:hypothetical protein